ncbi:MAG: class I SAM-dependent methyltransferase [Pseudomonadota bacterium]
MSSTFERSCAHWSAARSDGMSHFYALAWVDYQHLANARDWVAWLETQQRRVGSRPLELLDVACGSGKFPTALLRDTALRSAALEPVRYALLDPAPFSVEQARAALAPPFVPGDEYVTTLQQFATPARRFDVMWATHALYAVPPAELDAALARFVDALAGVALIAHSSERGHYIRCYEHYVKSFRRGEQVVPYATAEQIVASLDRLGVSYEVEEIRYTNGTPDDDRERIEGYLQRCVFDDDVSLAQMLATEPMASYLAESRDGEGWRFEQCVALITLDRTGAGG